MHFYIHVTGIAESLKKLLTDADTTVRQKSTECLYVIGCKKNMLLYFIDIFYAPFEEVGYIALHNHVGRSVRR